MNIMNLELIFREHNILIRRNRYELYVPPYTFAIRINPYFESETLVYFFDHCWSKAYLYVFGKDYLHQFLCVKLPRNYSLMMDWCQKIIELQDSDWTIVEP